MAMNGNRFILVADAADGRTIGRLKTGHGAPWALAVSKSHDLYVGNSDGTITAYHPGSGNAFRTLRQHHCCASGLAFGLDGTLFATDYPSPRIDVFGRSDVRPKASFTVPNITSADYLATDANGNLYVDGVGTATGSPAVIDAIDPATGTLSTLQSLPATPGGMAFDSAGNLIFNDQYGYLDTFAPPYTGPLAASFFYGESFGSSNGTLYSIAFDAKFTYLWGAAWAHQLYGGGCFATALGYPFGSSYGPSTMGYDEPICYGIAVDPPAVPSPPRPGAP